MKAHRKVLLVLIFGAGLPLVFLSAQLQLEGSGNNGTTFSGVLGQNRNMAENEDVPKSLKNAIDVIQIGSDNNQSNLSLAQLNRLHIDSQPAGENSIKNVGTDFPFLHSQLDTTMTTSQLTASDFFNSSQELEFVHITKTGGTAVEMAGGEVGLKWGVCHFIQRENYGIGCQSKPDWSRPRNRQHELALRKNIPMPRFRGEKWHIPPSWFRNSPYNGKITFTVVRNPYERIISEFYCSYFGYYRNQIHPNIRSGRRKNGKTKPPLPRGRHNLGAAGPTLIDDANQTVPGAAFPLDPPNTAQDLDELNDTLAFGYVKHGTKITIADSFDEPRRFRIEKLGVAEGWNDDENRTETNEDELLNETMIRNEDGDSDSDPDDQESKRVKNGTNLRLPPPPTVNSFNTWIRRAVRRFNQASGHMLPQSYYVYNTFNGKSHKVIDHVLKYENLQEEFANLMKQYGLEHVKLSGHEPNLLDPAKRQRFTVAHLESRTVCFINKRYAKDFELLGYRTIPACSKFDTSDFNDDAASYFIQTKRKILTP